MTLAYFHALLVSLCGFDLPGPPGYWMSVKEIEPAIYKVFFYWLVLPKAETEVKYYWLREGSEQLLEI